MATRRKRPNLLPGLRANEGLEAAYLRKLNRLIDDMHASLLYWLSAAWRAKPPEMAADEAPVDISPARWAQKKMDQLSRRWQTQFDTAAPELARWFALSVNDRSEKHLRSILKRSGWTVKFRMTREMNDVLQATIGEQVGLIKSIGEQHLSAVQGLVMRSVASGRDLKGLADELEQRYGVTRRRAALIAQHQNNMATAKMDRARCLSVGLKQGQWCHSRGGNHPRKSHVQAGADKVVFDLAKGWFDPDEKKFVMPGELINCRCFYRPVLPDLGGDKD